MGRLNLVDLAGSERQAKTGATGERFKVKLALVIRKKLEEFDLGKFQITIPGSH